LGSLALRDVLEEAEHGRNLSRAVSHGGPRRAYPGLPSLCDVSLLDLPAPTRLHDRPVVRPVLLGEVGREEREVVLAHDLLGLAAEARRVGLVHSEVQRAAILEEEALGNARDQRAIEGVPVLKRTNRRAKLL